MLHFFVVAALSYVYAFHIVKQQYAAHVTFFPPVRESSGLNSLISSLGFQPSYSTAVMDEQINTLFWAKSIRRKVIEEFNLYETFKLTENKNKFENTLKAMEDKLYLETSEIGGMTFSKTLSFTIYALHTSPDTAKQIVDFTFGLLDSAMRTITSDRAREQRLFVEKQLQAHLAVLDSLENAYKEFQITNKAYDIPEQLKIAVEAYADLKAALLTNEVRLGALKGKLSAGAPAVKSLQKENQILSRKLAALEKKSEPDVLPGLRMSTELAPVYASFIRDIEVQNKLILYLSKELEEARLKEARDVSPLIIIDPSFVPQYKAKPKRLFVIALILGPYMLFIVSVMTLQEYYRINLKQSSLVKSLIDALKSW